MKAPLLTSVLALANLFLALGLGWPPRESAIASAPNTASSSPPKPNATPAIDRTKVRKTARPPETPFAAVYSADNKQFVANLRAIGCPEDTIKDILTAEINRRYAPQENALRPKPADHVPYGWSAKTSEGKLIARRQEAAAIAREKRTALRNALGYDVQVKIPQYAMTTSDQIFERLLTSLSPQKQTAAQAVQDDYWANVQSLRERTRGFWQAEDVAQLTDLQEKRKLALAKLQEAP
jgi:hypothetical protein